MDTWLTLAQAADRTGLTPETIRKWAIETTPRARPDDVCRQAEALGGRER